MTSLAADQNSNLFVRTVELPDIPNLLSLLPAEGGLAWINGLANNQIGIVGWGEVARSSFNGPERFSRAQRWWSQQCSSSTGNEPIAFASFAFDKDPGHYTNALLNCKAKLGDRNGKHVQIHDLRLCTEVYAYPR